MGEARSNPQSPQYTGPLPENVVKAELIVEISPTEEWLKANPQPPDAPPPVVPPEHLEAHFTVVAVWVFPSALFRGEPQKWPGARVPVARLFQMPVMQLYDRVARTMVANGMAPPPPITGSQEPGAPPEPPLDPGAA